VRLESLSEILGIQGHHLPDQQSSLDHCEKMIGKREGNLYKAFGYIHFIFVPHLDFVWQSSASCASYEKNTKIGVFSCEPQFAAP
jgi:hypothetical protein